MGLIDVLDATPIPGETYYKYEFKGGGLDDCTRLVFHGIDREDGDYIFKRRNGEEVVFTPNNWTTVVQPVERTNGTKVVRREKVEE